MIRYEVRHKEEYETTFGPGGYTVYKVLTDAAGDTYYAPIADFKYKVDASLFEKSKAKEEKK